MQLQNREQVNPGNSRHHGVSRVCAVEGGCVKSFPTSWQTALTLCRTMAPSISGLPVQLH